MPPTARAPTAGKRKFRLRLSTEVLRHASNGPTAVSSKSNKATGTATRLKNGGPTVTLCPCTNSERIGKNVPHKIVKQTVSRRRLLNRKLDSRETSASSLCSLLRCDRFRTRKYVHTASVNPMNTRNQVPIEDCANACTELITPERVRKVPSMESRKVAKMSAMFQTFNMPRFSCIITECRNAVPVSQGISEAFSTGSHPQYPPQPKTEYAQCAPRNTPQVRKAQVTMVQRRVM